MITPRPYQQKGIDAAKLFFENRPASKSGVRQHAIMPFPTGAGKSIVIAKTAEGLSGNTLVLQPSLEILEQNLDKLRKIGFDPAVYSASAKSKNIGKITLAMIGSIYRKPNLFSRFKNIIIDECHGVNSKDGMYKSLLNDIPDSHCLGLTATPYRMAYTLEGTQIRFLTRTNPRIFTSMPYFVQCRELYDGGFWAPLQYFSFGPYDSRKIKLNSNRSEFDQADEYRYMASIGYDDLVLECAERLLARRKNLLIFRKSLKEAHKMASIIKDVEIVDGNTHPDKRREILTGFRKGQIKSVVNVGVLTTGFDFPELEGVLIARGTMSLSLWYQMVGRGVRPYEGKESWVVDMGDNLRRFGKCENLEITTDPKGLWCIKNEGRQLTNVFLDSIR